MNKFLGSISDIKTMWEECVCGNYSEMRPICIGVDNSNLEEESSPYYTIHVYKVLECSVCHTINILRYAAQGNEFDDEQRVTIEPRVYEWRRELLYATPQVLRKHPAIPRPITEIVVQAESLADVSPRASLVLCRAVLEEICDDFHIPRQRTTKKGKEVNLKLKERLRILLQMQSNLPDHLAGLKPNGLGSFPSWLWEMVDSVRLLGNEGAHGRQVAFSTAIGSEDVGTVIKVLNLVLAYLYVEPHEVQKALEELKALRLKSGGTGNNKQ